MQNLCHCEIRFSYSNTYINYRLRKDICIYANSQCKYQIFIMRKEILKFLEDAKRKSGSSFSAISRNAGLSPSTITRFIKDVNAYDLSLSSLNKIAYACGFSSYMEYLSCNKSKRTKKISDATKFKTYETAQKLLQKRYMKYQPNDLIELVQEVIGIAEKIGTEFISESLVLYAIEKHEHENGSNN
jgi:transcriptional regulator with XRE-family HTH domain